MFKALKSLGGKALAVKYSFDRASPTDADTILLDEHEHELCGTITLNNDSTKPSHISKLEVILSVGCDYQLFSSLYPTMGESLTSDTRKLPGGSFHSNVIFKAELPLRLGFEADPGLSKIPFRVKLPDDLPPTYASKNPLHDISYMFFVCLYKGGSEPAITKESKLTVRRTVCFDAVAQKTVENPSRNEAGGICYQVTLPSVVSTAVDFFTVNVDFRGTQGMIIDSRAAKAQLVECFDSGTKVVEKEISPWIRAFESDSRSINSGDSFSTSGVIYLSPVYFNIPISGAQASFQSKRRSLNHKIKLSIEKKLDLEIPVVLGHPGAGKKPEPERQIPDSASARIQQRRQAPETTWEITGPYYPVLDDELAVMPGDRVLVEQTFPDGWAMAKHCLLNRRGIIPMSVIGQSNTIGVALNPIPTGPRSVSLAVSLADRSDTGSNYPASVYSDGSNSNSARRMDQRSIRSAVDMAPPQAPTQASHRSGYEDRSLYSPVHDERSQADDPPLYEPPRLNSVDSTGDQSSLKYRCVANYARRMEDEININAGDIITVISQLGDGWANGFNHNSRLSGVFPIQNCVVLESVPPVFPASAIQGFVQGYGNSQMRAMTPVRGDQRDMQYATNEMPEAAFGHNDPRYVATDLRHHQPQDLRYVQSDPRQTNGVHGYNISDYRAGMPDIKPVPNELRSMASYTYMNNAVRGVPPAMHPQDVKVPLSRPSMDQPPPRMRSMGTPTGATFPAPYPNGFQTQPDDGAHYRANPITPPRMNMPQPFDRRVTGSSTYSANSDMSSPQTLVPTPIHGAFSQRDSVQSDGTTRVDSLDGSYGKPSPVLGQMPRQLSNQGRSVMATNNSTTPNRAPPVAKTVSTNSSKAAMNEIVDELDEMVAQMRLKNTSRTVAREADETSVKSSDPAIPRHLVAMPLPPLPPPDAMSPKMETGSDQAAEAAEAPNAAASENSTLIELDEMLLTGKINAAEYLQRRKCLEVPAN
ncbi:uncharacterized protein BJ171DRAFT_597316 [Polychytrium aggregatum]|uniref:uncharacterized protein n=1 Tax=Polychytrium aggregatum TaxID=110093 RepID=UPI0022FE574A|nr:uncharacterized protein BJ171DRAFT_597316 [Polychytrium aggregatum]KAI9206653.1 hypothetical protein BJ171DRAFT_597316 [Polychytrium aggregatum]